MKTETNDETQTPDQEKSHVVTHESTLSPNYWMAVVGMGGVLDFLSFSEPPPIQPKGNSCPSTDADSQSVPRARAALQLYRAPTRSIAKNDQSR